MVAGAGKVTIVRRPLLFAMGWADAGIHVENDLRRRVPVMNPVNPSAGKIGKRGEVFFGGQNLRLEAPHLTGRSSLFRDGMAADDPPHGGITAQTVGIVHVVVATKTAKEGLAELSRHAVPPVLAGAAVSEKTPGNLGQAKAIVKLPIGEKSSVGSDLGTVELKPEPTVKVQPQNPNFRFTHRVTHINTPSLPIT